MTRTQKPAYKLPEREWYNLEQAAKYIQFKTGYPMEVSDLWHYFYLGKLEVCVCITMGDRFLRIGRFEIPRSEFIFLENPRYVLSDGIPLIQGESDDEISKEEIQVENVFSKEDWGLKTPVYRGFLNVIPKVFNYAEIEQDFISKGLQVSIASDLMIPMINGYKEKKRFFIYYEKRDVFDAYNNYLKPTELYILREKLEQFLKGEDNAENKAYQEIVKAAKNPVGRPKIEYEETILELGRINAKHYKAASANKLAVAIRKYLETLPKEKLKGHIISETEILRKFKAHNIGAESEKQDRTLKITRIYTE